MSDKVETLYWAEKIGRKLRDRRKSQGLSLDDLSRLSSSTVPTLSYIERGKRDVKLSTLVSLAKALRIDVSDLFEPTTKPYQAPEASGYNLDDD